MCILTSSESVDSLKKLAERLINRYEGVPPLLLYRDCCCKNGLSKYQSLFNRWDDLFVRLDIWHFMRRLPVGCTCVSESHPLYGTFMTQFSTSIFEWDESDVDFLMTAKKNEVSIPNPSQRRVRKAINKYELVKHCHRRTRGVEENLLLSLSPAIDNLGVTLFREEMRQIWDEQKVHVTCLCILQKVS